MVGPVPRQAEDRDVHAARQAAGRTPDAGEAARDRRGLEPLRQGRRRARDAAEHPAPLARARAASRRLRAPRLRGHHDRGRVRRHRAQHHGLPAPGARARRALRLHADRRGGGRVLLRQSRLLEPAAQAQVLDLGVRRSLQRAGDQLHLARRRDPRGARGLRSARRRRAVVGAAARARHGRLRAEGGGRRGARCDHGRVGRGPALPRLAREGAPQVHGRRHRARGDARARRGEARPQARGLRAAADPRPAVEPSRRARAEAGGAAHDRRAGASRPHLGRPDDRDRRPRRADRRRRTRDAPAELRRRERPRERARRDVCSELTRIGFPVEEHSLRGELDRLHRRAALQLLGRGDEDAARRADRAPRPALRRRHRRPPAPARRLPALVRAALDRRPRLPGNDRARRGRRSAAGVRHLRPRRARSRRGDRAAALPARADRRARLRRRRADLRLARRPARGRVVFRRSHAASTTTSSACSPGSSRPARAYARRGRLHERRADRRAGSRRAVRRVRGRGAGDGARAGRSSGSRRASPSRPRSRSTASR